LIRTRLIAAAIALNAVDRFPRHLSRMSAGFVWTVDHWWKTGGRRPMQPWPDSALLFEWDKVDIQALGILEGRCARLCMLTCISAGFDSEEA